MTRYFFSLSTKGSTFADTKGREFPDLAAAHRHAMHLVHKMALLDTGTDWRGWYIKVTDMQNGSVLHVLFPHASHSDVPISATRR
jgi:hypothetical protein